MPTDLPGNPDFEQLRKLAKDLARAHRAAEPEAIARVDAALPHLRGRALPFRLSHAQATLAREYGFPSWPKLKLRAEQLTRASSRRSVAAEVSSTEMQEFRGKSPREMANAWVALAQRGELNRLLVTMTVGRAKGLQVRDLLAQSGELSILVDVLLIGARHRKPNVRHMSAHAMDMFSDERCAAALLELLDDPVPRVRRIAAHSLVCDDCKVVPFQPMFAGSESSSPRDIVGRVVDMALNDPSIQVRRHAVVAIAHFEDARARQAIETLIERETDVPLRRNALSVLRRIRAKAG